MTHHPIAQIAPNGNPKSQEIRPFSRRFLQKRLLHSQLVARRLNGSAIFHGRLPHRRRNGCARGSGDYRGPRRHWQSRETISKRLILGGTLEISLSALPSEDGGDRVIPY